MRRLKGWKLFGEIKNMKKLGFNKSQATRNLGINYETVSKYWNMSPDDYAKLLELRKHRKRKLSKYEDEILQWLRDYPDMSAAQVHDWLVERYGSIDCSERTVRNLLSSLRNEYNIPKQVSRRQHEAVDELPAGYQVLHSTIKYADRVTI